MDKVTRQCPQTTTFPNVKKYLDFVCRAATLCAYARVSCGTGGSGGRGGEESSEAGWGWEREGSGVGDGGKWWAGRGGGGAEKGRDYVKA